MKLSYQIATPDISTPNLPSAQGTLEENLDCVAEAGFEAVELSVRKPDELDLDKIGKELSRRDLSVSMIHTASMGFQDRIWLCHPVPEIREVSCRRHVDALGMAQRFGCGLVIGSSRGNLCEDDRRYASVQWMRDALLGLADEAAAREAKLYLEPLCSHWINNVNTAAEGAALCHELGHDALVLMLDTYHMNVDEASFTVPVLESKELLGHMHIAENNRFYPGGGHIPFGEVIGALRSIGYTNYLTCQIVSKPDIQTAARLAAEKLRTLIADGTA